MNSENTVQTNTEDEDLKSDYCIVHLRLEGKHCSRGAGGGCTRGGRRAKA